MKPAHTQSGGARAPDGAPAGGPGDKGNKELCTTPRKLCVRLAHSRVGVLFAVLCRYSISLPFVPKGCRIGLLLYCDVSARRGHEFLTNFVFAASRKIGETRLRGNARIRAGVTLPDVLATEYTASANIC